MGWWIALDVLLWAAGVILFILAWTLPSFVHFLIGLGCIVVAIVILCVLAGRSGSSGFDTLSDITIDFFD